MIIKGTKQLGSFKRGINIYVPKKKIVIPPAPSGIPVASTERVNVTLPPVIGFPATSTQLVGYYSAIGVRDYWVDGEYGQESWSVGENINYLNSNFYWSAISRFGAVELIAPNNYSAIANHAELFDGLRSYWRLVYWEMNCSDGYCSRNRAYLFNCVNGTNPNLIPTTNWSPSITITPSGIPTATANSIILQSGENLNGAEFYRQNDGYFGDFADWKLVWSGTRWEILGDNLYLAYYSLASNQTVNLFPDQGSWFRLADSATVTLVFVGT